MNVHTYQTTGGKDLILDYLDSLPKNDRATGLTILDRLRREGIEALQNLITKQIDKKVWEIKFSDNRIFYVLVDEDNIYLLHACKKQKNKTEKNDKEKAIKRAKQIKI